MNSFSDLIDAIGFGALARAFEVASSHVRTMKARNSVPPEYWGQLIEAASEAGVPNIGFDELRAFRHVALGPSKRRRLAKESDEVAA